MKGYIYSVGAVMLLGSAVPAMAQGYFGSGPQYPLHWYADLGATVATGQTSNFLETGGTIGGGLQWRPQPGPFSLRLDLSYSHNNATQQLLQEGAAANQTRIDHGWADIFTYGVDAVYDIPFGNSVTAYLIAGGGGGYRRVSLTQRVFSGRSFCDDWWGICVDGSSRNALVAHTDTNRFEWNAGVGLNFAIYRGQSVFVEAKYVHLQTTVPTTFVPIRVGYRF